MGRGQSESYLISIRRSMPPESTSGAEAPAKRANGPDPVRGRHEVIVESPNHVSSLADVEDDQAALVCQVYRDRFLKHAQRPETAAAILFKNAGPMAGASLTHIHSQLIALPFLPDKLRASYAGAERYFAQNASCYFCDLIEESEREGRIVLRHAGFTALCPPASRFAYETWILPDRHRSNFDQESDDDMQRLAPALRSLLGRVESILNGPSYNFAVHSAPHHAPSSLACQDHYHWHIAITPRQTMLAGF